MVDINLELEKMKNIRIRQKETMVDIISFFFFTIMFPFHKMTHSRGLLSKK